MKKRWGSWVLLLVVAFVVAAGGCGGGGDDGDNGDKTFSDLPTLPPAPATSGAWADAAYTSWYGEDQSAFTISTAEQLAGLSKVNRSGLYGKTVTLANDIDLAGREWTPVWIENFNFDGGGRTVSNMTITSSDLASLFYGNTDGIIKNVNLTNVYIDVSST